MEREAARLLQRHLRMPDVVLQVLFSIRRRTFALCFLWLCLCPIAARSVCTSPPPPPPPTPAHPLVVGSGVHMHGSDPDHVTCASIHCYHRNGCAALRNLLCIILLGAIRCRTKICAVRMGCTWRECQ